MRGGNGSIVGARSVRSATNDSTLLLESINAGVGVVSCEISVPQCTNARSQKRTQEHLGTLMYLTPTSQKRTQEHLGTLMYLTPKS